MSNPYHAWTLGWPPGYEEAIRLPGNAKVPGGYAFRTRDDAAAYAAEHPEAARFAPYEILLPVPYEQATTRNFMESAQARHSWHTTDSARPFMKGCGVCDPSIAIEVDHELLLVMAPFVNPDIPS